MADTSTDDLNERFAAGGKPLEVDVVGELQSIMRLHQLSVQDLFFKWESYCIKMDMEEMRPKYDTIRGFKQDLQDALERNNRSHAAQVKIEKRMGATPRGGSKVVGGDVFGILDGLVPSTPGTAKLHKSSASAKRKNHETPSITRVKSEYPGSSPSALERQLDSLGALTPSSFHERPNPGEVIEVLNTELPAAEPPMAPFGESRIKLTAASDLKKLAYRPLAMKLSEASEILDDRIEEFTTIIMEHHQLDESALGSAANQSTSEIICVGRIASDTAEGRLNAASLVLETSRRIGGGLRAPLNLQKLPGYQFFPGQIVALRGTNASGHEFNVTEILEIPLLPSAASAPQALEAHRQRLQGGPDAMDSDGDPMPLNVIFASGPFSADDNLDFEPLHALCSRAADTYVDALVLTGPFIDIDHPLIASGDFDLPEDANVDPDTATMATVFKHMISPALNHLASANPQVTIVLVPSVRDAVDKHVSWPQDAFPRKDLGLPKATRIVGNPMTFSINETQIGISSQDVLYQLQGTTLAGGRAPQGTDRLARLARSVIEQRHYFPVFPPMDRSKLPKTGTAEEVALGSLLDVSYLKLGEMVNVRPDVLVLPSAMPPFARVVDSVLVINPGYLSKRRGPGTYAKMTLYPPKIPQSDDMDGVLVGHDVYTRARIEITKI